MSLTPDFKGRVALVTGASRGIGKAVALALAEAGADVAINYRARGIEAASVASQVQALSRRALSVGADVSSGREVRRMVEQVTAELGPIDILVNNAGIGPRAGLDDMSEAIFDETIAVNLKSAFLCSQAVYAGMRTRKWGRIVNITSGAARGAGAIGAHYNASKAGMEGLTRGYAARLVKDGVTVNAVAPSLIETEMMGDANNATFGRRGTPEEVAQAVLMVLGNPYMTGQTVAVNGGLHFS